MKQSNLLFMSAAMMLASCGGTKEAGQNGALIERSDIKIEGQRMTPEALWAMGRIGQRSRIARRETDCLFGSLLQCARE